MKTRTWKTMSLVLLLAIFAGLATACGMLPGAQAAAQPTPQILPTREPPPATATPETESGARLRITNAGDVDIKNLVVRFPEADIRFGDVPAGATTEYQPAPGGVYNYAAYEFELNGEAQMQPVIDWVGETGKAGSFTYTIRQNPAGGPMLMIELMEVSRD